MNIKLEKEVDSLKGMINDTAEQRNGFRAHADSLSAELVRNQKEQMRLWQQLADLQRDHEALKHQQEVKDFEQEHTRERWAQQLKHAEEGFSEVRQKLILPADLEAMRAQSIEDALAPWRARANRR